jgi:hypothetical protein
MIRVGAQTNGNSEAKLNHATMKDQTRKFITIAVSILAVTLIIVLWSGDRVFESDTDLIAEPARTVFAAGQTPRLEIDLAGLGIPENISKQSLSVLNFKRQDRTSDFDVAFDAFVEGKSYLRVKPKKNTLKPGRYTVQGKIETAQGQRDYSQDFYWGVLALNFDKSIYNVGEDGWLQFAVLDDTGNSLCGVELTLKIKDARNKTKNLSTSDGSIVQNEACKPNSVIDEPDYYAYYTFNIPGVYQLELTAETLNGTRTITDYIEVTDQELPFIVARTGPTRIYPYAAYDIKVKITANQDFSGLIRETVPASFIVTGVSPITLSQKTQDGQKFIEWPADLKKGQTYELSYSIDAPDIAPEFYLLGPIELRTQDRSNKEPMNAAVFKEARQWQIASDALLEYYETSDLTATSCTTACPTTFTTFETLTVDRTGESVSKDFLILASMVLESDETSGNGGFGTQLTIDGTVVTDIGLGATNVMVITSPAGDADAGGLTFSVVATTTIAVESIDIDLDYKMSLANDAGSARDASIVALELPSGTFAEQEVDQELTGSNTGQVNKMDLTFTPPAQEDYLLIGYTEGTSEDWNDSGSPQHAFVVEGTEATSTMLLFGTNDVYNAAGNNAAFVPLMAWDIVNLTAVSYSVAWFMKGNGTVDEAAQQQTRILAIPLTNFSFHYESDDSVTNINSTNLSTVLSLTATVDPGNHIILFHTESDNEDGSSETAYVNFQADGDDLDQGPTYEFDDSIPDWNLIARSYAKNLTGGSKTFTIQGASSQSGGPREARYRRNRILALRVPWPPAPDVVGDTGIWHIKSGKTHIKSGRLKINLLDLGPLIVSWVTPVLVDVRRKRKIIKD